MIGFLQSVGLCAMWKFATGLPAATHQDHELSFKLCCAGVQELCLPYELCAADIDEAEPLSMLLLVTYLFTALPQLLPRATLDFSCKLGDQQVRRTTCTCKQPICRGLSAPPTQLTAGE